MKTRLSSSSDTVTTDYQQELESGQVQHALCPGFCKLHLNFDLRNQIYMECRAMAKYALARGKAVPASVIKSIEAFEIEQGVNDETSSFFVQKEIEISPLVDAHDLLTHLIEPAIPQTVLLLDNEQRNETPWRFLGAVPLVRQLMMTAIICLIIFIGLLSSPYISNETLSKDVLAADGMGQLARLIFYISSAGLGASFAALYKVNDYISKGTYEPSYQTSYWIRFLLGIIAGLLLAVLISEQSIQGDGLLSKGVIRPLLAILGGFSADLLYTFLNRMVETFKSLFESSTQSVIDAKAIETKSKLASLEIDNRMKLAQNLIQMQQSIGSETNPEQIKEQINEILKNLTQSKQGS